MTNSLTALAYSQICEMSDWNSTVIDPILVIGKAFYNKVYPTTNSPDYARISMDATG